jgi:hypothetical protein
MVHSRELKNVFGFGKKLDKVVQRMGMTGGPADIDSESRVRKSFGVFNAVAS